MKIKTNIIEEEFRKYAGKKSRQEQEKSIALVLTLKLRAQFHSFLGSVWSPIVVSKLEKNIYPTAYCLLLLVN